MTKIRSAWIGELRLGDSWALYVGPVADQTPHAHVALQLAVGLDGPVTVALAGDRVICAEAVAIGPMVQHRVPPGGGPMLLLYADPRGALGRVLWSLAGDTAAFVPGMAGLVRRRIAAGAAGEQLVAELVSAIGPGDLGLDARLGALVQPRDDIEAGVEAGIGGLASRAGLSNSGFRDLARRGLGVPPARYALWRKLELALRAAASGESPAAAAGLGGFADQAHMARTLRRMFGVTLSELGPLRSMPRAR
ncbi:AraC family transcriptional regulator [Phenylobacterium sp. 58.2.17]|uniref:AraC family transcriptional regulator n=1 Tax=Phenylobacterium sp. 58.2.17 TaxID=2969306 RepID=UPI00226449F0|nr:AraC family transcriptional regulator [Phenylobacterium sp. 58.2.17]MCX7587300.1 helix-turn-helix domain-containing protein [Phenylobacterium sp. 58.2.17]